MPNSPYNIDVYYVWDADLAIARLEAGAMGLDSYLNSALVTSSWMVKEEMASRAPQGVGAANGYGLKDSVNIDIVEAAKTAEIKPTAPYSDAVETGSQPHMPPTDPDGSLAQWCEMKGLPLWPVAMKIKHYGTQPHPFIEPTYEAIREPVASIFETQMAAYAEEV